MFGAAPGDGSREVGCPTNLGITGVVTAPNLVHAVVPPCTRVVTTTAATLPPTQTPERAPKNDGIRDRNAVKWIGGVGIFTRCELCGNSLRTMELEEHIGLQHFVFIRWSTEVLARSRNLTADIAAENIAAFGRLVAECVTNQDKGPEAFDMVVRATDQLRKAISQRMRGHSVFLFGSCVSYGCWDGVGDADFTVLNLDRIKKELVPINEEAKIKNIASVLRSIGFRFDELEPVLHTRVPIVRHVQKDSPPPLLRRQPRIPAHWEEAQETVGDREKEQEQFSHSNLRPFVLPLDTRPVCDVLDASQLSKLESFRDIRALDFDVSCRAFGVRNSWFLRRYLEQNNVVRCGGVFLKKWSKKSGVNNPVKGFLSSYAVSIMWIHYLLTIGYVEYVDPDSIEQVPGPSRQRVPYLPLMPNGSVNARDVCDFLRSKSSVPFQVELGRLVIGFFRFYVFFEWQNNVVTLRKRDGKVQATCSSLGWVRSNEVFSSELRDRVWYRMCIEDPYEVNLNLARHISSVKTLFVRAQFVRSLETVMSGKLHQVVLDVTGLAGEVVSTQIARLVLEEGDRKLEGKSSLELMDLLSERVGDDTLGICNARKTVGSLSEACLRRKLGSSDKKESESNAEGSERKGGNIKLNNDVLRLYLRHIDSLVVGAGDTGLPLCEVPVGLQDMYLHSHGRVFNTAEACEKFSLYHRVLQDILLSQSRHDKDILVEFKKSIPTCLWNPDILSALLGDRNLSAPKSLATVGESTSNSLSNAESSGNSKTNVAWQ